MRTMVLTCLSSYISCGLWQFPGFLFCTSWTVLRHFVGCSWLGVGLVYLDRHGLGEDAAEGMVSFSSPHIGAWTSAPKALLALLSLHQLVRRHLLGLPSPLWCGFPFQALLFARVTKVLHVFLQVFFIVLKNTRFTIWPIFKSTVLWMH